MMTVCGKYSNICLLANWSTSPLLAPDYGPSSVMFSHRAIWLDLRSKWKAFIRAMTDTFNNVDKQQPVFGFSAIRWKTWKSFSRIKRIESSTTTLCSTWWSIITPAHHLISWNWSTAESFSWTDPRISGRFGRFFRMWKSWFRMIRAPSKAPSHRIQND